MKRRILIVDDDSTITQQLYWTLSETYDVVTANDLPTAMRREVLHGRRRRRHLRLAVRDRGHACEYLQIDARAST